MMNPQDDPRDSRRQQKAWQEDLSEGKKIRVMLKSALTPPADPVSSGTPTPQTRFTPTMVEVWVCIIDYDTVLADDKEFPKLIVTDEVLRVAVYDPTMPSQTEHTEKDGPYGHVEMIGGILELTWLGC